MFSDDDDDLLFMGETFDPAPSQKPSVSQKSGLTDNLSQNSVIKRPAAVSKVKSGAKKQNTSGWVTSAFDDFLPAPSSQETTSRKRPREQESVKEKKAAWKRIQIEDELWYEKHAPKNQGELAVHKKKIGEVLAWLQANTDYKEGKAAPILLLTGPAGCGKTATVRTLARELRTEVQEWINPITNTEKDIYDQDAVKSEYSSVGSYQTKSQLTLFEEFLLRANKYPTLQIFGGESMNRKIVLVEDFPNVFLRDASVFHNILRRYRQTGRCPLVFIVTDSAGGDSNERRLFPKDVQAELGVDNISFNPVAPTVMAKILDRIAASEARNGCRTFCAPSKAVVEGLASVCSGDIRGAINALQFACLVDTNDLTNLCKITSKTKSKSGRKHASTKSDSTKDSGASNKESQPTGIGGKDASIFLFRALGKILYCKREDDKSSEIRLPAHLLHHRRPPLAFDPEDVVERSCMSADCFTDYLHQNYLDFYPELEDVVRASQYISTADSLTYNWASRPVMSKYASSIATRGLLHANTSRLPGAGTGLPGAGTGLPGAGTGLPGAGTGLLGAGTRLPAKPPAQGPGWKPLHKPQWYDTKRKMMANRHSAEDLFRTSGLPPRDLQTELVPYLALISTPLRNPAQISFVQTLARFNKYLRPSYDRLGETDVADMNDDSQSSMDSKFSSQVNVSNNSSSRPGSRNSNHSNANISNHSNGSNRSVTPMEEDISCSQNKVKDSSQEDEFEIEEFDY